MTAIKNDNNDILEWTAHIYCTNVGKEKKNHEICKTGLGSMNVKVHDILGENCSTLNNIR